MSKMIEMDVRRGAKQIKKSGHKFISDKSYKERIKKLSAVNRASWRNEEKYEMACVVADREEFIRSQSPPLIDAPKRKFKLPRKQFFDDCNGVEHVSVPRKLRSAMKKRNGESSSSLFPDSKKPNYFGGGVKSPKKIAVKRSKLNLKQGGPNFSQNGPITKDEEEVVETLYALAGMFPDSETNSRCKTDSALALKSPPDSHTHKLEAMEEDLNAHCLSKTDEAVNLASDLERLPENSIEACSLNGPSIHIESKLSNREELHGFDSSIAHVKLNKMLDMHEEQKPPGNSVNFCLSLEPYKDDGKVKQPVKVETKPEIALGLTTTFGQLNQPHMSNEPKKNASWTGFASTSSSTSSHGPLLQSCAAKIPAWFGTRPSTLQNDSATRTVFKGPTDQRSQKKCASHIYISRLIKSLQKPETKENHELLPNKLKPQEILKQGVLTTVNNFSRINNDLIGVSSPSNIVETTKTSLNDTKNGNLQHLRIQQDHSLADLASGAYTSQKQSFNFLSLSAGGGRMESNISYNRAENRPESMATLQSLYQTQNPTLCPFSMYQTRDTSAYPLQPSAAAVQQVQLQLPPSFSNAFFGPPQASPKAMTKQQQIWASQWAQYRNTGTSTPTMHFPSLQNGRQDSPAMVPRMAPSAPNVEVVGPKYPNHQQQQQYVGFSLQHGILKRQDHPLSSVYEETENGFRAGGSALPMQLLCNERL